MHVTMVKKRLADGTECRKCAEASRQLEQRGLWSRIDEVLWASEDGSSTPGDELGHRLGVDRAPFFVVRDDAGEHVYTSVLRLIRDRFKEPVADDLADVDPDDIGGI
jgi:hypothetical protein